MGTRCRYFLYRCFLFTIISSSFPLSSIPTAFGQPLESHLKELQFHAFEANRHYHTCSRLAAHLRDNGLAPDQRTFFQSEITQKTAALERHIAGFLATLDAMAASLTSSVEDPVLCERILKLRQRLSRKVHGFINRCRLQDLDTFLPGSIHKPIRKKSSESS